MMDSMVQATGSKNLRGSQHNVAEVAERYAALKF